MKNGDTVWIFPHGSPPQAVPATIDRLSKHERTICLRLHHKPAWCRIAEGFCVHQEHGLIAMVLYREKFGPWIEMVNHGHYEIEESKPE